MGNSTLEADIAERLALIVRLGSILHAIPIEAIEEVLPNLPVEPLTPCPPYLRGIVFVRGHLIPVVDGRTRLGIVDGARSNDPHIVCLRLGDRLIGLEVDEAIDLMGLDAAKVVPAGKLAGGGEFVRGVIEQDGLLIRVLIPDNVLAEV